MTDLKGSSVIVVGAGVFGSAIALAARRAGADVMLIDRSLATSSASAIAAGMLAPAFEAALDPTVEGRFTMLAAARDLWTGFAADLGPIGLERCGALCPASSPTLNDVIDGLRREGAGLEIVRDGGAFTPDDWRLDPLLALAAMRQRLTDLGGQFRLAEVATAEASGVGLDNGDRLGADAVVMAGGYDSRGFAPELAVLTPIRGQLLRFADAGPREGPIIRDAKAYLTPCARGAVVGATMEPGRTDIGVDADVTERLSVSAARLDPSLATARPTAYAGIRPASPDGLPIAGQSANGLWLATGARRNGWLWGPAVSEVIVKGIGGEVGNPNFAPSRFY